jgi:uncharacterized protein YbjT (DUF2867 family)
MKVLVLGATGKTGSLVMDAAVAKGHEVSVLVRDVSKISRRDVRVIQGDATKRDDMTNAVHGQEAVIDTIGGTTPWKTTNLETRAAENIIEAMRATAAARRLIVVSMMGLGESREQAPFWYKYILMKTFLHGSTADKGRMEDAVRQSGLDYTIVRPPILADTPATGGVTVLPAGKIGHKIARADLANFLVEQLGSSAYSLQAVTVVHS